MVKPYLSRLRPAETGPRLHPRPRSRFEPALALPDRRAGDREPRPEFAAGIGGRGRRRGDGARARHAVPVPRRFGGGGYTWQPVPPARPDRGARTGHAGRGTSTRSRRESRRAAAAEPLCCDHRTRRCQPPALRWRAPRWRAPRWRAPRWRATSRTPRRASPQRPSRTRGTTKAHPPAAREPTGRRCGAPRRGHRVRRCQPPADAGEQRGGLPAGPSRRCRQRRSRPGAVECHARLCAPAGARAAGTPAAGTSRPLGPGKPGNAAQVPTGRPDDAEPPTRRLREPAIGAPADRVQAMARWLRDADTSPVRAEAMTSSPASPADAGATGPRPGPSPAPPGSAAAHTEVTVTIGRIEVKAPAADPAPTRPRPSGQRRAPSLDDYLESRTRARGRLGRGTMPRSRP